MRKLVLTSFLLLYAGTESASAACSSPAGVAGQMLFQSPNFLFCDGTNWTTISNSSIAALSCADNKVPMKVSGSWSCVDAVAAKTNSSVVYRDSSGNFAANNVTVDGLVVDNGSGTAQININPPLAFGTYTLTLPDNDGNVGEFLQTNGSGVLSWAVPSSSIAADSLDFDDFIDSMTLDASTDFAVSGTNVFSITNSGTGNSLVVNDEAGDTTPFVIAADGKVGIGDSTPNAELHVYKQSNGYAVVRVENDYVGGGNNFAQFSAYNGSKEMTLGIRGSAASGFGAMASGDGYLYTAGTMVLMSNSATGSIEFSTGNTQEKMRLNASGALGIGTQSPNGLLDVKGSIVMSGSTSGYSGFQVPAAANNMVYTLPASAPTAGQFLSSDASGVLSWAAAGGGVTADSLDFTEFKDAMTLDASTDIAVSGSNQLSVTNTGTGHSLVVNDEASDSSPFIIDTSGHVGVGAASPSSLYKLFIDGADSSTNGILVRNKSSTADRYPGLIIENYNTTGTTNGFPRLQFRNYGGSNSSTTVTGPNQTVGGIGYKAHSGSASEDVAEIAVNTGSNFSGSDLESYMVFKTRDAAEASPSEKIRITQTGNVGIGTESPNQKLTVEGPMSLRAQAAPTLTANYGKIYVDSGDSNKLKYMNPAGTITDLTAGAGGSGDFLADGTVPMTGAFRSIAGAAATPGITFVGDTNTGVYSPASDAVAVAINGSEKMRVDAGGMDFNGVLRTPQISVPAGTTTIDVSQGNYFAVALTGNTCTGLTLNNMEDGTAYTFVMSGVTSGTCTFSDGASTFNYAPANAAVTSDAVYTVIKSGSDAYVSWVTDFGVAPSGGGDFMKDGSVAMTGNLQLGANWLSNDGGSEGIQVSTTGAVSTSGSISAGGSVLLADGTAAAPSLSFSGDTDTGFYRYGADNLQIALAGNNNFAFSRGGGTTPNFTISDSLTTGGGRPIQVKINSNAVYTDTSAAVVSPGAYNRPVISSQNPSLTDGSASYFELMANNANDVDQYAYIGAVSNSGATTYSPSIVIGQRTGDPAYTERMRIDGDGNVGIGTISPNQKLTVEGVTSLRETTAPSATANYGKLYVKSADSKLYYMDDGGTEVDLTAGGGGTPGGADTQIQFNNSGAFGGSANFVWDNSGNELTVTGDISYTGVLTDTSDRRLKSNIERLPASLPKIRQMQPYSYTMKADPDQEVEFGLMAQDLQEIIPEVVKPIDDTFFGVNYMGLIAWIIKAMQELDSENEKLKSENEKLKANDEKMSSDIKDLKQRLEKLERLLNTASE